MNQDIIRQRIQERLDAMNYTPNFASEKAGLDRSVLGKFLAGRVQAMKDDNLRAIAEVLRVDFDYLRGSTDLRSRPQEGRHEELTPLPSISDVPIVGIVEAGAFRPVDFYEDANLGYIVGGYKANFAHVRQFGFVVRGDSMDRAGINDGDEIVCIDPIEAGYEPTDEDLVVVENSINGGHTRELTVKRLRVFDDHYELVPCSSNPKHKPLHIPKDAVADDGRTVRIVGIVLSSTRNFRVKLPARNLIHVAKRAGSKLARTALVSFAGIGIISGNCIASVEIPWLVDESAYAIKFPGVNACFAHLSL